MTLPVHQLVAVATRLAVLASTHGIAHALADAIAALFGRMTRPVPFKALRPALHLQH